MKNRSTRKGRKKSFYKAVRRNQQYTKKEGINIGAMTEKKNRLENIM